MALRFCLPLAPVSAGFPAVEAACASSSRDSEVVIPANGDDTSSTEPPQWIADTTAPRPVDSIVNAALTANAPEIAAFVAAFPSITSGDVAAATFEGPMNDVASLVLERCE